MNQPQTDLAALKRRQLICQNSPELRDLERQLQTAYNRQILESLVINKRAEREHEKILDKQFAQSEEEKRLVEDMRVQHVKNVILEKEKQVAEVLKLQMIEKQKRLDEELANSIREAELLKEQENREKMKERRIAAQKELQKKKVLEEQKQLCRMRQSLKENEKLQEELISQLIVDEEKRKEAASALMEKEKQDRIMAAEALKDKIAIQLIMDRKLKEEYEELRLKLICAERELMERNMFEEEKLREIEKKRASKQSFADIERERLVRIQDEKEVEILFAANMKRTLELQKEWDRLDEERKRCERLKVREDNYQLIKWKQERSKISRMEALAEYAAAAAEEEARKKVVAEERLRLLKSVEPPLLDHLPKGSLTEEDCLNLNYTGKKS